MRNTQSKYPNRLKEFRVKRKLKQKEVATLIGLKADDRICRWEQGQSMPSYQNILKLSKLFEVSSDEIYDV
jgi:transcriptional regulator with XRE-family HTH domain